VEVGAVRQPWRLAGQYCDDETGLHYVVARYYDPQLGRFLTVDPVADEGMSSNPYLYCDGDPINRADPTGTIGAFWTAVIVGAVIGVVVGAGIEAYRQREAGKGYDGWQIAKAGLIGGVVGAIGGAVGAAVGTVAAGVMGVMAAGAVAGGAGAAAEYCAEVALTDTKWDSGNFWTGVGIGAGIGAVTAGVGGIIAARAARKTAQAARAAAKLAKEAEGAAEAARKAAKLAQAAKEADDAAKAAKAAERARRFPPDKQQKVLYGERVPNPNSPNGMSNEVIGGHSPRIKNDPSYNVEEIAKNSDGTTTVKFIKDFPDGKISQIKKGNLAPDSWSDDKILEATQQVADVPPVATRARDGATLHRETIDGVQWEVIKDPAGNITSSYPTGGTPTQTFQ
jgi:RHS repeat-associated protein